MHHVSELAKTRRFTPAPDPATTKFVRVDDLTTPFTPYDSLEISAGATELSADDAATTSLEIEIIEVPLEAPACERSLIETTPFAQPSEPYERITIQPIAGPTSLSLLRPLLVAGVLLGAFACGVGAAFAL